MRQLLIVLLLAVPCFAQRDLPLLGAGSGGAALGSCLGHTYSTVFPATENPLSEGSCWTNLGQFGWNNVQTTTNKLFGTVSNGSSGGLGDTKDPSALANGTWGNDQQISGVAVVTNLQSISDEEIELRPRNTAAANNTTGYEVNWILSSTIGSCAVQGNRWNGTVGNFTALAGLTVSGAAACPANGDTLTATMIGTTLNAYKNGVKISSVTDATFASGKPGIGTYYVTNTGSTSAISDFGWSAWRATDAPLVSKSHGAADTSTGTTVAATLNTTGTGCIGVWVYWNSTTATATVSGSVSGAFTSAVGPTTILGTYRMQGFSKCGMTTGASDVITATISTSGIDHAIAASAIQGVTALDQAPAINAATSATCTSTLSAALTAADEYLLGACVFGNVFSGLPSTPTRYFALESANFGGNVLADGISTVNGSTQQFSAPQNVSATFGGGIMTFK